MSVRILDHPLASHLMTLVRDSSTEPAEFRRFARLLTMQLALEATRDLPLHHGTVTTPLEDTAGQRLAVGLTAVPILRAGLAMLEPIVELFPNVNVGYIGLARNEETAEAEEYYRKLPNMDGTFTLCLDPMLATGGSASRALSYIKDCSPTKLVMVSVVAAPEGIARLGRDHPDVDVVTASVDRELNPQKYILPGLGDFGDRLYGTL